MTGDELLRAERCNWRIAARAYHRALKLARTIADLAGAGAVGATHLAEALQYRPKEGA